MRLTRTTKRAVAVTFAAAALGLGATTSAYAAEGTWTVTNGGGCQALEKVQLMSGHDYMANDPIANSGGCSFGIYSWNTSSWVYGPTGSGAQSPWIYDGPGNSLSACVWSSGNPNWVCGPAN
ncbi:hypothetical protein P3T27_005618 [Kitasatospora sp. MAA19]|uniref:hypothetical protein n=1 Tax=unclassified Kitasatospora TaxID=2633591 RepID=UPI0024763E63|nr:hypothetical protein [Kitasatospora sp. MAA19]MDH6708872.1 hypothetical protein [Kitasatospora sp. MAA19]